VDVHSDEDHKQDAKKEIEVLQKSLENSGKQQDVEKF